MKNLRLHFPHISRIFSAPQVSVVGNLCLWALLLALISFNVFWWLTKPLAYSDKIIDIFTYPFSAIPHETLAHTLTGPSAQKERAIVAELSPVLGASTTALAQKKEADMIYWQNILTTHPDYRDAYVQLAELSYQKGNLTQAHGYLVKALALDPNNTTVNRLVAFTSKLLE